MYNKRYKNSTVLKNGAIFIFKSIETKCQIWYDISMELKKSEDI